MSAPTPQVIEQLILDIYDGFFKAKKHIPASLIMSCLRAAKIRVSDVRVKAILVERRGWFTPVSWLGNRLIPYAGGEAPQSWTEVLTVPARPGLYALYDGADMVYIGESYSLHGRLGNSHQVIRQIDPTRLRVKICAASADQRLRRMRELELILRLRPRHNREWMVGTVYSDVASA